MSILKRLNNFLIEAKLTTNPAGNAAGGKSIQQVMPVYCEIISLDGKRPKDVSRRMQ